MSSNQEIQGICDKLSSDLQPINERFAAIQWKAECTGDEEAFAQVEALSKKINERLSNREEYQTLEDWYKSHVEDTTIDDLLKREVRLWLNRMASQQYEKTLMEEITSKETNLSKIYNSFRAQFRGNPTSNQELERVLKESNRTDEVKEAWTASKGISTKTFGSDSSRTIAQEICELAKLRNQAANQIGYENYYEMSLDLNDLPVDWLYEQLGQLEEITNKPFFAWKEKLDERLSTKFGIDISELMPWHYGDPFFQHPPTDASDSQLDDCMKTKDIVDLTIQSFDSMGFDIRKVIERSDLYPGDPKTSKKCQHAFCTTIIAPDDVRVLCNIVPSERWMTTNLHEYGHAVYCSGLSKDLPYIMRDDPQRLMNEAIAILMQKHLVDREWLTTVAGMDENQADSVANQGQRKLVEEFLVFTRWVLTMCHMERELYKDPSRNDLHDLWWEFAGRFQGLRKPVETDTHDEWASKFHFVGAPVYYQNYIFGDIVASALFAAICSKQGSCFGNNQTADFLNNEMFANGARYEWRELFRRLVGEEFHLRDIENSVNAITW